MGLMDLPEDIAAQQEKEPAAENNAGFISRASSTEPPKDKLPVARPVYHGGIWELFKIHIINLLLNICTLGIYSFWGKTRIRRYVSSHIAIGKDRMEYTGTGKELFIGFLKAWLIYMPISFAMNIPVIYPFALLVFFALISLAIFLALRYRLSRTRWRGIRFSLGGLIKEYLILALKRTFFNIVSLGWVIPKSDMMKWDYIANHMKYGEQSFRFQGDHKRLQKTHLKTVALAIILSLVMTIIPGTLGAVMLHQLKDAKEQAGVQKNSPPSPEQVVPQPQMQNLAVPQNFVTEPGSDEEVVADGDPLEGIVMLIGFMSFLMVGFTFYFVRLWYQAALWREQFRGLCMGDIRFKMDMTGWGLLKLKLVNGLIILFSLGILAPIAYHRSMRYYTGCLKIGGDLGKLEVLQSLNTGPDGTGDALAADVGFDMGF